MEINVLVDETLETELDAGWLEGIARRVLEAEKVGPQTEMGLVVSTQERVQQLNRDYRHLDEPTDVLAFSATMRPKAPPLSRPPTASSTWERSSSHTRRRCYRPGSAATT